MTLGPDDAIVLAPDVSYAGGTVTDHVRAEAWPVNDTAALVLRGEGRRLELPARQLAERYGIPFERALADVVGFAAWLNALLLVNVRVTRRRRRRLADAWRLAVWRLRLPPPPPRRHRLGRRPLLRATLLLGPRALVVGLTATGIGIGFGAGAGSALAVGAAVAFGLLLHEAAHVAALRGRPAALVTQGLRISILHRSLAEPQRTIAALAGPLAPGAAGVVAALAAASATSGALAWAACALAAHALGATVAAHDGRVACRP